MDDRRLRRGVVRVAGLTEEAGGRPDEDEAAVPVALHLTEEGARREKGHRQVPTNGLLPAIQRKSPRRDVLLRPAPGDRGADVQSTELLDGTLEQCVDLVLTCEIRAEEGRATQLLCHRFDPLAALVVVQEHLRAFRCECPGTSRSDAARSPRDQHPLSAKPGVHRPEATFLATQSAL